MEGNELLSTIQPLLFTQPTPTQVVLAWERGQGPRCIATAAIYQLKHGKSACIAYFSRDLSVT